MELLPDLAVILLVFVVGMLVGWMIGVITE